MKNFFEMCFFGKYANEKQQIRKSLFLLWISHFFIDFFTGIWPIYKTIAKIDIAKAGLMIGVAGFIGESLQVVFGYLSDQGHRKVMLIIGLVLCTPMLCISSSHDLQSSFFILLSMMIGSAAFHPAAAGMVPALVREQKTRNLLLFNLGGAVGFGFSQIIFLFFFLHFKGDLSLLLLFPGACILMLLLHQFPKQALSARSLKSFLEPFFLYRKPLSLLYCSQVVYQGMRATFLFFLPEVLQARCSSQWISHGGGFFFFVFGTAIAMMPAGHLADKYGLKRVLLIIVGHTICLFYWLILSKQLTSGECLFLLMVLGALFGVINPLTISWGHSLVPQSPSTVSGLLMGLAWCVGNLSPAYSGALHVHFAGGNERIVLSIMGVFLVAVFFLLLCTPHAEKERKHVQ